MAKKYPNCYLILGGIKFYCQAQSQLQLSWTELVYIITLPNKFADPRPVSHPGKYISQQSVVGFHSRFIPRVSRHVYLQILAPIYHLPNIDIFWPKNIQIVTFFLGGNKFYCQAQSQLQLSWTELVFNITLPNKFADPQPVSHP